MLVGLAVQAHHRLLLKHQSKGVDNHFMLVLFLFPISFLIISYGYLKYQEKVLIGIATRFCDHLNESYFWADYAHFVVVYHQEKKNLKNKKKHESQYCFHSVDPTLPLFTCTAPCTTACCIRLNGVFSLPFGRISIALDFQFGT